MRLKKKLTILLDELAYDCKTFSMEGFVQHVEMLAAVIQEQVFQYSLGHELSISISSHPETVEFLKAMGLT